MYCTHELVIAWMKVIKGHELSGTLSPQQTRLTETRPCGRMRQQPEMWHGISNHTLTSR